MVGTGAMVVMVRIIGTILRCGHFTRTCIRMARTILIGSKTAMAQIIPILGIGMILNICARSTNMQREISAIHKTSLERTMRKMAKRSFERKSGEEGGFATNLVVHFRQWYCIF